MSGHNRRTCTSNSTFTSPADKAIQPVPENARTASGRRKPKCGYCAKKIWKIDRSHTSRICPERKAALAQFVVENSEWAKKFKTEMMEKGFGIGSLVERRGKFYIIQKISWEHISLKQQDGHQGIKFEGLNDDSYFNRSNIQPPSDRNWDDIIVSSPISPELVEKQFPRDWENGMYGIPEDLRDTDNARKKK